MQVQLFPRLLAEGSIGLGNSYMDGWWDCRAVDQFVDRVVLMRLNEAVTGRLNLMWLSMKSWLTNRQSYARANQLWQIVLTPRGREHPRSRAAGAQSHIG